MIGVLPDVEVVPSGTLPRSEKKTKRIHDQRQL
jgi:phenylacetate-coenzyme A ligase PaaK-like adenylate-forming protein